MHDRELEEVQAQIAALKVRLQDLKQQTTPPGARSRSPRPSLSRCPWRALLVALLCAAPLAAYAAYIAVPHTFVNGTVADAGEVNANFGTLVNESNDQDTRLGDVETDTAALQADVAAIQATLVPGTVMLFDLASCPPGWSPLTGAAGRALVGGGTAGGTVGVALSNLEDRSHAHNLNPPVADTASAALPHTHFVDPPAAVVGSAGQHSHIWSSFDNGGSLNWYSYDAAGNIQLVIDWNNGMDTAGTGNYPLSRGSAGYVVYYTDAEPAHDHTLDIPSFESGSSSNTGHTHSFDLATTTSTSAATSDILPYVQLLVCRLN